MQIQHDDARIRRVQTQAVFLDERQRFCAIAQYLEFKWFTKGFQRMTQKKNIAGIIFDDEDSRGRGTALVPRVIRRNQNRRGVRSRELYNVSILDTDRLQPPEPETSPNLRG